jgi:hypothetical protein
MSPELTIVETADGSYEIRGGEVGTYPWVRQASLIAAAYHDGGDDAQAYEWTREYNKRRLVWDAAQSGADLRELIASMPSVDLVAPFRIIYDLAAGIVRTVGRAAGAAIGWAEWLPWLAAGVVGVAALGFYRGTLRVRR